MFKKNFFLLFAIGALMLTACLGPVPQGGEPTLHRSNPGQPAPTAPTAPPNTATAVATCSGSPGHLRVTVTPEQVTVDYVRAYVAKDEKSGQQNGQVSYSYIIQP